MFWQNSQIKYRGLLISVTFPLIATAIQWSLWAYITPFSWFLYWPAICLCILYCNFTEGILAILLASACAWWFFVPDPLNWGNKNYLSHAALLIFLSVNITASYLLNRLRKQGQTSEQKLFKAEDTYHFLLNSLVDGVFVAQDHKFVLCNPALPSMLGYPTLEFVNMPFEKVVAPPYLEVWTSRFDQRISGVLQPEKCYEAQFIHKNGNYLWIELRANLTAFHEQPAVLGIVRDITHRKLEEKKLYLADAVFQNTQEGIVVTNLQRDILLTNPAFSTISEYSAEELLGTNVHRLYVQDKNGEALIEKKQLLEKSGTWQGALWKRRKSGDVYREWVVINTIYNETGEPIQYVDISIDISRIKHIETYMEYLAHHDALTGLPNRLLLHSRLEHTLELAKRKNEKCAIMYLDLDGFKSINDIHGHAVGDEVLKIISQRMKVRVRDTDTLARLSGDEFVIILHTIKTQHDAVDVAESIVEAMSAPCALSNGTIITTGVSIGISLFPDDGVHAPWLLNLADQALYKAKHSGRARWHFSHDKDPM